jgi:hypothetical protein
MGGYNPVRGPMRVLLVVSLACLTLPGQVTPPSTLPSFVARPQSQTTTFDFSPAPEQETKNAPIVEVAGVLGNALTAKPSKLYPVCSIPLLNVVGVETNDKMVIPVPPAESNFVVQAPAPPCDRNYQ